MVNVLMKDSKWYSSESYQGRICYQRSGRPEACPYQLKRGTTNAEGAAPRGAPVTCPDRKPGVSVLSALPFHALGNVDVDACLWRSNRSCVSRMYFRS